MLKSLLFVLVTFFSAQAIFAAKPKPLPPVTTIESKVASIEDAMERIYVSADIPVPEEFKGKLEVSDDIIKAEIDAIQTLIDDKSVANSEKEIIAVRYTSGDPRVKDVLLRAKAAGIKTIFISDVNPVMTYDFGAEGPDFISDFSLGRIKQGGAETGGQTFAGLLEGGFQWNVNLFSQPLYNPKRDRTPILHEKALLLRSGTKKITFLGTANWARNPRYNRIFKFTAEEIFDAYHSHVQNLISTYKEGKETKDMADENQVEIVFANKSRFKLAYTNGKYNPNDRIVEALKKKLVTFTSAEFVVTNRPFIEALAAAMEANPEATGLFVGDDKFASLDEWGLATVMNGIGVDSPFARDTRGFKAAIWKRIKSYVYQRPAIDPDTGKVRIETAEGGPPTARHVLHDKTFMMTVMDVIDGVETAVGKIYSGSFNLSNNIANAEFQFEITTSPTSLLYKIMDYSIKKMVEVDRKWAVPMLIGTIRNAMGSMFGLTDLEVKTELAEELYKSIKSHDYGKLNSVIEEISKLDSRLAKTLPAEERARRLKQSTDFFKWYNAKFPTDPRLTEYRIRKFLEFSLVISKPEMEPSDRAQKLLGLLWTPGVTPESQQELLTEALGKLGYEAFNPFKGKKAYGFDWDDTIMFMRTKIILYKIGTNETKEVGTGEYAKVRSLLGKPGEWEQWEARIAGHPLENSSIKFFASTGAGENSVNYFKQDLVANLENPDIKSWKGPYFEDFIKRLRFKSSAELVTIITARAHEKGEIMEGLVELQKYILKVRGYKIFLPKKENIIAVGKAPNPALAKAEEIGKLLTEYSLKGISEWTFYDDDKGNVEAISKFIAENGAKWPGLKTNVVLAEKVVKPPRAEVMDLKDLRGEVGGGNCHIISAKRAS